jgi:hypothetical protein
MLTPMDNMSREPFSCTHTRGGNEPVEPEPDCPDEEHPEPIGDEADEDEPIPDYIFDLMAEDAQAMDLIERGLCL